MIFTSLVYVAFLVLLLAGYWLVRSRQAQNVLLLVASYAFYGWITPWFCYLLAFSTVLDYTCALGMARHPERKKAFLVASLVGNLGMLGVFKYFNFFADNVHAALVVLGLDLPPMLFRVALPVGISFYTFQTLSYTIDVYRGVFAPRKNFIDVAVFVAFFPQLVAGPIERAAHMIPQIEKPRSWRWNDFDDAWRLLVRGYVKKLVIADNIAPMVDHVFMLNNSSILLLAAGSLGFAMQVYADFSAYTDIARGSGKLLGFDLMENFKSPYLALTPSEFWRRWHISLSSWLYDYLYISLLSVRSTMPPRIKTFIAVMLTLGLSGLWHGADWHFIWWGLYHGLLLVLYHLAGRGGRWRPAGRGSAAGAWALMMSLTLVGYVLFRAPSMGWLSAVLLNSPFGAGGGLLIAALHVTVFSLFFSLPLLIFMLLDRVRAIPQWLHAIVYGLMLALLVGCSADHGQDFIYFKF